MLKKNDKKNKELRNIQQQYIGKIDSLRKEHAEILNGIRRESLKREEDRNNQWIESERELLNVLNGLSMFFDINEKLNKVESEKILAKLQEIEEKLINNIKSLRLSNNG
jgi:RPA family protein